jgi:hypothetical protein
MKKYTNGYGWYKYSSPEVSEFIKPELYMMHSSSYPNQSGNIQHMKANNWYGPLNWHVAAIAKRLLYMDNWREN